MVEYVKEYGAKCFKEQPLTVADSLVLCQIAYFKFERLLFSLEKDGLCPTVSLRDVVSTMDTESLFSKDWFGRENQRLFQALSVSERYLGMYLTCFVNQVKEELQMQFSAITYLLDDGTVFVAYRGTDETFIGWKEDFGLALSAPVWAQQMAVEYLNTVAKQIKGRLFVAGHSKGGNLAVYGAMRCNPEIQRGIKVIINLDGPGLRKEYERENCYRRMEHKVLRILPYSSLVGMLFESRIPYRVVDCYKKGLLQHDLFNWKIRQGRLVYRRQLSPKNLKRDSCLNQWIQSLSQEEIRFFTESLYEILLSTKTNNTIDFSSNLKKSMIKIVSAFRHMDGIKRKRILGIFKQYYGMKRKQSRVRKRSLLGKRDEK